MTKKDHEIELRHAGIAQRIKKMRMIAGFTQAEVAEKLGISFQQLQKYESGKNRISAVRVELLAQILGLPVSAFFEDSSGRSFERVIRHVDKDILQLIRNYGNISSKKLRRLLLMSAQLYAKESKSEN